MTSPLSKEQLRDFARDGFLVVRGLYSSEEVSRFSEWIDELASREPGKEYVFRV